MLLIRQRRPGGESDPSPVVTYVLDTSIPKIALSSPKDGATINGDLNLGTPGGRVSIPYSPVHHAHTGSGATAQQRHRAERHAKALEHRAGAGEAPVAEALDRELRIKR